MSPRRGEGAAAWASLIERVPTFPTDQLRHMLARLNGESLGPDNASLRAAIVREIGARA